MNIHFYAECIVTSAKPKLQKSFFFRILFFSVSIFLKKGSVRLSQMWQEVPE